MRRFEFDIAEGSSGTHAGIQNQIRHANEMHNNNVLYQMYPNFHHAKGTKLAMSSLKELVVTDPVLHAISCNCIVVYQYAMKHACFVEIHHKFYITYPIQHFT